MPVGIGFGWSPGSDLFNCLPNKATSTCNQNHHFLWLIRIIPHFLGWWNELCLTLAMALSDWMGMKMKPMIGEWDGGKCKCM
jgi:hypothetical protein